MRAFPLLLSVVLFSSNTASSEWLEWNAGCPEGSEPLVIHNGTWDSFLTFDVELRGFLAETVTVDSQAYLRFPSSPGTVPADIVGYPEIPVVRRMVWLPDDSDIALECSASCCEGIGCLPVYPAPLDSLVTDSTGASWFGEYFRQDSAAYASEEWYPDVQAELVGEFRLRDLRVGIVDVYPVQYLASEDSLRVWSDIEISLSYDTTASWPTCDLGCYEGLIGDRLLGYSPEPPPWAPIPGRVSRPGDLESGPGFVPDYMILVASGLDGWWVDTLAHHRADLDGFDVAIARTDSVLNQFGGAAQAITPDIIRDFTEAMWDWGSAETKRPSYLLLIGDHEDPDSAQRAWFLPTKVIPAEDCEWAERGSDGWYAGFGDDPGDFAVFPDMVVGRLPARTPGLLRDMITSIRSFEAGVTWPASQGLAWRRSIIRLEGVGLAGHVPTSGWTDSISSWAGYAHSDYYCGDGDPATSSDGSTMSSRQWCEACEGVFETGAQMVFYTDHGAVHYFDCGADGPDGPPDSTFDNLDINELCQGQEAHGWPFVMLGSCSQGTFNWTDSLQYYAGYPPWSYHGTGYDFTVDCFAEALLENTAGGAIAVTGSSWSSYHQNLLIAPVVEGVLRGGITRVGDAVASGRVECFGMLWQGAGWNMDVASYNLLGDPAVDIGDRVKFRDRCDLIVSPGDIGMAAYPTRSTPGSGDPVVLHIAVRNAGAIESGAFDAEMTIECGSYDTLLTSSCDGIDPGQEKVLRFRWRLPSTVSLPATFTIGVAADLDEETPDSWFANNDASAELEIKDAFPNESGWPVLTPGSIESPPCLVDIDGDEDLEIVAVCGMFCVCAYEPDGELVWITLPPSPPDPAGGTGYSIPAAGSVCGGPEPEIVIDCQNHICILDGGTGEVLYSYEHPSLGQDHPHAVTLADIIREGQGEIARDEIAFICGDNLYLMGVQSGSLVLLDSEPKPSGIGGVSQGWVTACDLDGSAPTELIVSLAYAMCPPPPEPPILNSMCCLYRYQNGQGLYYDSELWRDELMKAVPAVGRLAGSMRIALSRLTSNDEHAPAYILDTGLTLQDSCQYNASLDANQVLCCMMTDWDSVVTGADAIVSPTENQAFAWRDNGQALSGWPESYDIPDSYRPPFPALGELDDEDQYLNDDLVVATRTGWVMAFESGVEMLEELGFPYMLPSEVNGGFCMADIDGDERVELVFGTMDNYLHVWELGSCDEYFSPWPQCQHDAARTGVLE